MDEAEFENNLLIQDANEGNFEGQKNVMQKVEEHAKELKEQ